MCKFLKSIISSLLLYLIVFYYWNTAAQSAFFLEDNVSQKINFEFTSDLIIIPIEINGVTLSFLLDTGVSKPILFNLSEGDSLELKNTQTFYLHGLGGDGKLKALKSSFNKIKIGNAVSTNKDLYVVFDNTINFTPRLGILVHGIIGYDIFKDFIVEINYSSKFIRLYKPNSFKPKSSKKWKTIPINIHRNKPYVDAMVKIDELENDVKLLLDTGSSDALWLFENKAKGIMPIEDEFFDDYLGKGLSGSVYGKRSKVNAFKLSDFNFKRANVAFPDSTSIDLSKIYKGRNGSLGGAILKRFHLFFDYKNEKLHLRKNSLFKDPFTYNNSGIVLEHNGSMFVRERIKLPSNDNYGAINNFNAVKIDFSINYRTLIKPSYKIVELRSSSNAYKAGLMLGDILIKINGKPTYNYKLPEINRILHGETGKTVRLNIERNGVTMFFKFKLDNAFKKNEPSN